MKLELSPIRVYLGDLALRHGAPLERRAIIAQVPAIGSAPVDPPDTGYKEPPRVRLARYVSLPRRQGSVCSQPPKIKTVLLNFKDRARIAASSYTSGRDQWSRSHICYLL